MAPTRRRVRRGLVLGALLVSLVVPSGASAAGSATNASWGQAAGYSGFQLGYTVAPASAPIRVFYFNAQAPIQTVQVVQGGQATCQVGQPDGSPNQAECFFSGTPPGPGTRVMTWFQSPGLSTSSHLQLYLNTTGTPPYDGPFDVAPAMTSPPPQGKKGDETIFDLIFGDPRAYRPTALGGMWHHRAMDGLYPDPISVEEMTMPRGFSYSGGAFKHCSFGAVMSGRPCRGAIIGSGRLFGVAHACDGLEMFDPKRLGFVDLTLINGGAHDIYGRLTRPDIGRLPYAFDLRIHANKLSLKLPDLMISPSPGRCTPVTDVQLQIDKRVKHFRHKGRNIQRGLVQNGTCGRDHKFHASLTELFTDGQRGPDGKLTRDVVEKHTFTYTGTCRSK